MEQQSEVWVPLTDLETNDLWDRFEANFRFNQFSFHSNSRTFLFSVPFDEYDISRSNLYQDNVQSKTIMKDIFIDCMKEDDFMYALDWEHSCYRYNPRILIPKDNPTFIHDDRYSSGGYNAYFPEFYPNGDFFFFISRDFSWGYLTHPWLKKAWVFGSSLMPKIRMRMDDLGFIICGK
jgi:hypothetical protein